MRQGSTLTVLASAAGLVVFGVAVPVMALGDHNGDGDVDLDDYREFPACLAGPAGGLGPGCGVFDSDGNGHVDLFEVAQFQRDFTGPLDPPPGTVFIPRGEYLMGDHDDDGLAAALPVHAVYVDPFFIDRNEVTNLLYTEALNWAFGQGLIEVLSGVVFATGGSDGYCDTPGLKAPSRILWDGSTFTITPGKEDHPMMHVSWFGAAAYANWRSEMEGRTPCYNTTTWTCDFTANGHRLPTEAEWEKAARGGLNDPYLRHPWGDEIDDSQANYLGSNDPFEDEDFFWTTPVAYYDGGQSPPGVDMANGYGLYDAMGNAWEWCNDWYDEAYYDISPFDNPRGPSDGTRRVLRGGGWISTPAFLRSAYRHNPDPSVRLSYNGFRLALGSR